METTFVPGKKYSAWLIVGLVFIALFGFIPAPAGLTALSMRVIGIFVGTIILWLKVSADWPSFLCIVALLLAGATDPNSAFSTFLGNSTCAFLVFSYMLAGGLAQTGILRRWAVWFITRRVVEGKPWTLIFMLLLASMLVGLVMIPSTMIIIFLPLVEQIFKQVKLKPGDKLPEIIVLAMAFTGSIAQGMTPIGHAHPLIAMSLLEQSTGYAMSHAGFMTFAIPVGIIVFALMFLYFRFVVRPDVSALKDADTVVLKESLGPMGLREKYALAVFMGVVVWWLSPTILKPIWPSAAAFVSGLGNALPALVGVTLLCVLRPEGIPIIRLGNAAKEIAWPVIFMVGATMVLSSALTGDNTGISAWIGIQVGSVIESLSPVLVMILAIVWVVAQTNFSSNAVSVTLVYSVMVPLALLMPERLNPYALTAILGSACCYAFATPLSTAVVAIACGTEWVDTQSAWKHGAALMLISIIIFAVVGYPLAQVVFPFIN